eukprot:Sdes_comp20410_c0_seq1m14440
MFDLWELLLYQNFLASTPAPTRNSIKEDRIIFKSEDCKQGKTKEEKRTESKARWIKGKKKRKKKRKKMMAFEKLSTLNKEKEMKTNENETENNLEKNPPKKRKVGKKAAGLQNKEAFLRINFLYQCAIFILKKKFLLHRENPTSSKKLNHSSSFFRRFPPSCIHLSIHYSHLVKIISRKLVLRLDPFVKRFLCKQCHLLLLPSFTCLLKISSRPLKLKVICLRCGYFRKFLCHNSTFQLFHEKFTPISYG